ncbi:nucleotidyl transferase AbiEii/AbiGii toxin family protein [Pseudomonadota bacterium AL_CKDN230030165-1A_HGKHYDSX7]
MTTSAADITNHRAQGPWRTLERRAHLLVESARAQGGASFSPKLGGGTRLMLAFGHRLSDDIDLFVDSPGWLPYVSPRLNDVLDSSITAYTEDNAHVKLMFAEGEIDFIVAAPLLDGADWNPAATETAFELESPAEILAKKLFFRGWALTARDLFDWYVVEHQAPASAIPHKAMAHLLASKFSAIETALTAIVERTTQRLSWQQIRTPLSLDIEEVANWATGRMAFYRSLVTTSDRTSR